MRRAMERNRVTRQPWFKRLLLGTADDGMTAKQMAEVVEASENHGVYPPDLITRLRSATGVQVVVLGSITNARGFNEKLYRVLCPGDGLATTRCPLCGGGVGGGYGLMGGGCGEYVFCKSDGCPWMHKEQDTEGMEDYGDQDGQEQGEGDGPAQAGEARDGADVPGVRDEGHPGEPVRGPDAREAEAPGHGDAAAPRAGAADAAGDGGAAQEEPDPGRAAAACPRCGAIAAINCSIPGCPNR